MQLTCSMAVARALRFSTFLLAVLGWTSVSYSGIPRPKVSTLDPLEQNFWALGTARILPHAQMCLRLPKG